jgi:hypothetical protein
VKHYVLLKSKLIQHPGARGGRFWFDRSGLLRYGSPPKMPGRMLIPQQQHDYLLHIRKLLKHGGDKHVGIEELARRMRMTPDYLSHVLERLNTSRPGAVSVAAHDRKGTVSKVRIDRAKAMGVPEDVDEYTSPFLRTVRGMPNKFSQFVPAAVLDKADELFSLGVSRYEVAKAGTVSAALTGTQPHVTYSMFARHSDHGEQLLRELHEDGIACPYRVYPMAVAEEPDELSEDSGPVSKDYAKTDNGRRVVVSRAMQYVLDFRPADRRHADMLVSVLNKRTARGGDAGSDAIPQSWDVPDIRTNAGISDEGEVGYLNKRRVGQLEIMVLSKTPLADSRFKSSKLRVDSGFHGFTKSLFMHARGFSNRQTLKSLSGD